MLRSSCKVPIHKAKCVNCLYVNLNSKAAEITKRINTNTPSACRENEQGPKLEITRTNVTNSARSTVCWILFHRCPIYHTYIYTYIKLQIDKSLRKQKQLCDVIRT